MKSSIKILGICILCLCHLSLSAQRKKRDLDHPLEKRDSTKRTTFNGYPFIFYTPEAKLGFGAGGIFVFYTAKDTIVQPSKIGFAGWYSTNKQYKVSINPVFYFFENNLYFKLPTSYGFFVDKFYGIGNATPDNGNASYTRSSFITTLTLQIPPYLFSADRTGIIIDYDYTIIKDKRNNGLLLEDAVTGSNGGRLLGIGSDLVWDSRDNIFYPNSGGYQYLKLVMYPGISDYTFGVLELDARHFHAFKPDQVLAFQFYFSAVTGDPPFYKLPAVGGSSKLRGYFYGRYRDRAYAMTQLEYRQYFSKRFGFVVFAGTGDVAGQIMDLNLSNLKYSYGGGLRFLFNQKEKINLRMDLGFGNAGNRGIYFGIEEAF